MQEEYMELQSKMEQILDEKMKIAKNGERVWNKVRKKLFKKNDFILLFPNDKEEILRYGMKYMDAFAIRNSIEGICVCTDSVYVKKNIDRYASSLHQVIELNKEDVDALITYYSYFPFEKNFEIVSFSKPFCRDASNMIGKNGITEEELIAIGVYKLIPFQKM